MGADKLFHRRKAKQANDLARRKAKRDRYAKVLIVTEGEKTEPNYFIGLTDSLKLNSANIVITGKSDSAPISIVDFAIQKYQLEKQCGDPFDKVYCVFDRDAHESYQQAIDKITSAKPKDIYAAIISTPCFEYWLLLHFVYTTAQFQGTGNKSACEQLIDELKKYTPEYAKNDKSIFEKLSQQLQQAKVFSARSLAEATNNNDNNPSTHVHTLVDYLENIKK